MRTAGGVAPWPKGVSLYEEDRESTSSFLGEAAW